MALPGHNELKVHVIDGLAWDCSNSNALYSSVPNKPHPTLNFFSNICSQYGAYYKRYPNESVIYSGFKISLVWLSETSKNDSRTSGIPGGLVHRTAAYFWFSYKLHWLYIFQTSEWHIRRSDFYNPLARRASAYNLKFGSQLAIL